MFARKRQPGPIRFLITCVARTGSTMLVHSLRYHDDVCCHGEVFGPGSQAMLFGIKAGDKPPWVETLTALRDADPVAFLRDFVFCAGSRAAVGVKLKHEELQLPQHKEVRGALVEDRDVRVLHLTRDNLLKRFVSQVMAVKVNKIFNTTSRKEVPPLRTIQLSPRECREDFEHTASREAEVRQWFAGHPILELKYEHMVADYAGEMARVQNFLGVPIRGLETKTQKMTSDDLWKVIENYEELSRHFRGTPFAKFFDAAEKQAA